MDEEKKIDGRSIRQKNIYDKAQQNLIKSAIELLQDPKLDKNSINVSLIAENAGTSVATAYNHFPNNMVDVFGSIFNDGFKTVEIELAKFLQTEKKPHLKIEKFVELQAREIVPFDVLLNLCKEFSNENSDIDATSLAYNVIRNFNGCLFMWMRFNKDSDHWSKFTDDWFLNETSLAFSQALAVQNI
jgi:ribosomal protein L18E